MFNLLYLYCILILLFCTTIYVTELNVLSPNTCTIKKKENCCAGVWWLVDILVDASQLERDSSGVSIVYWNIGNVTLTYLQKTRLTRTALGGCKNEITYETTTTTTTETSRAYRTLFETTKVLAPSRPPVVNGSRVLSASRKFLWQARRKYRPIPIERSRRRKLSGNVFRFDVCRCNASSRSVLSFFFWFLFFLIGRFFLNL